MITFINRNVKKDTFKSLMTRGVNQSFSLMSRRPPLINNLPPNFPLPCIFKTVTNILKILYSFLTNVLN